MMSGAAAITCCGRHDAVLGVLALRQFREHLDAAGDLDQLRHPADAGDHRLVPFLEIDARAARQLRGALARLRRAALPASRASASALRGAPTSAPSVRIIARMPATSRWLKACTATLRRISSAAMSACRSEKVRTRSGSSARIFSKSARDEGGDARLLLAHPRRPHRIARDADDAALLAEKIERLDGLLGQADDAFGRKHRPMVSDRVGIGLREQFDAAHRHHAPGVEPHHRVAMRRSSPAWWLT